MRSVDRRERRADGVSGMIPESLTQDSFKRWRETVSVRTNFFAVYLRETVTAAAADFVTSALLTALTLTVAGEGTEVGAV